ncbi:MAG TPA: cation-transporting P-type ATPase [Anaerolineales bacterium]|nr:cation-transporting P-type ATPase [Anaerolineales bacterium]
MSSTPIYSLRIPEVYQSLVTSQDGLTTAEAASRRSLYGDNVLSEQPHAPAWVKFIQQVRHPFILLMLLSILISLWQRDWTLAFVIFLLTIANSAFSFWREYRAEKAIDKLRQILPSYARAIRDGKEIHLPANEVVPGDILVLAEGDNIPADARVVEEYGLRVNNASLTGEAVAARKTAEASILPGVSELERPNLIFAGTSVASGTGKAIVYGTGMLTQFGRIAQLTQTVQEAPSAFHKELERMSRRLTLLAVGIGAIAWALATFEPHISKHFPNPLLLALGVIVAVTPEGLPATLTLSLAMAVQRLAGRGVLAKRLSVVETLGNVSVICTDKSGTLTQNQMTVREVWVGRKRLQITGVGYEPKGHFMPPPENTPIEKDLLTLLEAALCCNNSRLNGPTQDHPTWTSLGDQTEAALKVAAFKYNLDESVVEMLLPRIHEIPFDARRKRMTTIHREVNREIAFVKGAPREVLQLCSCIQIEGQIQPLTDELRAEVMAANDDFSRRALRVLGLARRDLELRSGPYTAESVEQNLTFLGLMAMMDPPRPEVEKAIQVCREAGIRIVMITGDYGLTAESLARRVGLVTGPNALILTGAELDAMNDAALQDALEKEVIFARMAPDHKLRLVSAYQAKGEVVAVTGDGVNDAPALRKADVGVSMGMIGTDVAKEAADIILTDDNFSSIVAAIEEGRAIYDNIRKFITYIFSSNVSELFPFLVTSSFGIPPALTVRQILAIDMGTDILPALALGTEKPEPDIMKNPPRLRSQPLLDRGLLVRSFLWLGLLEAGLCYLGFLAAFVFSGNAALLNQPIFNMIHWPHLWTIPADVRAVAKTVFLVGVVTVQIGNAFACRTAKAHNRQMGWGSNRVLLLGIAFALLLVVGMVYFPVLSRAFENASFPPIYWLFFALSALILYTLEWFRKGMLRRIAKPHPDSKTQ